MTTLTKVAMAAICGLPLALLTLAVICAAIRSSQVSELERREQFRKAFVDRNEESDR